MSKRRTERILQLTLVALVAVFLAVASRSFYEPNIQAGDTAPNFKITASDGRTLTRSDFGGKVLVLNFWATWCAPCIEEIPSLDAMQRELNKDVVVLAISIDQDEAAYKKFLQRNRVSFLTARDPEANISGDYGTFKYPETYVITRDGKVRRKLIAAQNWMDPSIIADIRSFL